MPSQEKYKLSEQSMKQWESLPGFGDIDWNKTSIGQPSKWCTCLQVTSTLIVTFPHPTAIYWSDDFSLLANSTWFRLREGTLRVGQSQTDKLSEAVLEVFRSVMIQNDARTLEAGMLFDHSPSDFHVLCSPIVDTEVDAVGGVLCQLLPYQNPEAAVKAVEAAIDDPKSHGQTRASVERTKSNRDIQSADYDSEKEKQKGVEMRDKDLESTLEQIPLDKHPFFRRFADLLPTGIAILNHEAEAVFVNEHFYQLTTVGRGDEGDNERSFDLWPHTIHEDYYEKVMGLYQEAFKSQKPLRTEFRAKDTGPNDEQSWRLLLLSPLLDDNLHHASLRRFGGFICAIVDITSNKIAELRERKAAKEAQERKEQQERFIDMISHEIRNPLSAVLHCAEDIVELATEQPDARLKEDVLEAADTIKLCVNHQKNIVDDILSFSKLDAAMLSLNPKASQPRRQLGDSLKMFTPEFRKQSITFKYECDYSYRDHKIDWVRADLTRISQVLVNLITNAIKFTAKKDGKREVSVAIGACIERPTSYPPNVVFFDTENSAYRLDGTLSSEWGQGEAMYILCAVIDSGIGISAEGQKRLFERFRQATPKTEEIYGGSGLGLNISRKLCHLHGGEIGVKSHEGKGSTFGFFFKVRRTEPPSDESGDQVQQSSDMKDEVVNTSNQLQRHVDEADVPASLSDPPYASVKEASIDYEADSSYEETADIASEVDQEEDKFETDSRSPRNATGRSPLSRAASTIEEGRSQGNRASKDSTGSSKQSNQAASGKGSGEGHTDDQGFVDPNKRADALKASNDINSTKKPMPTLANSQVRSDEPPSAQFQKSDEGKIRVLLVEDNVINAKILRRKLQSKNFAVQVAVNGQEAVDAVQKSRLDEPPSDEAGGPSFGYDVVLMDQEMPVKDGLTASREIRAWEKERRKSDANKDEKDRDSLNKFHIPILGVSANVRDEHRSRMEEAGIDDFLGKPYTIDEIVKKISNLLSDQDLGEGSKELN